MGLSAAVALQLCGISPNRLAKSRSTIRFGRLRNLAEPSGTRSRAPDLSNASDAVPVHRPLGEAVDAGARVGSACKALHRKRGEAVGVVRHVPLGLGAQAPAAWTVERFCEQRTDRIPAGAPGIRMTDVSRSNRPPRRTRTSTASSQ